MILNTPIESKSIFNDTISFLKEINPDTVTFNQFKIFPGSPLYYEIVNKNAQFDIKWNSKLIKKAYRMFYLRPSYFIERLLKIRKITDIMTLIQSGFNLLLYIFIENSESKENF